MPTTISFWVAITGWVATLLGGAWKFGKFQQRLDSLEAVVNSCHLEDYMTEEKCREKFAMRQETSTLVLTNIQKSIDTLIESVQKITDSQHQRQVDFATMTEQMKSLTREVVALSLHGAPYV